MGEDVGRRPQRGDDQPDQRQQQHERDQRHRDIAGGAEGQHGGAAVDAHASAPSLSRNSLSSIAAITPMMTRMIVDSASERPQLMKVKAFS